MNRTFRRRLHLGATLAALVLAASAHAEERAPCREHTALRRPFFGDLHVHTALSLDANTQGTRNLPRDAYRFARGETIGLQPYAADGTPRRSVRLDRPLDFAAVTDHAELFGELELCRTPGSPGYDSATCRVYRWWPRLAFFFMNARSTRSRQPERFSFCGPEGRDCLAAARTPWREVREAAEDAYDRSEACRFTSFVGYEWTGGPDTNNIHRNILFNDAAVPELPVSYMDEPTPEGLWRRLRATCNDAIAGCDFVSIPHNSNLSGGIMFESVDAAGRPLTAATAAERITNEPLVEVMQHKGDSECRLGPETEDELCGFEKLPYDNFQGKFVGLLAEAPPAIGFVRNVLKEGLRLEREVGVNPFAFGLIASTDTHLGTSGYVREAAHLGHGGAGTGAPGELPRGLPDDIEFNAGGLAVLWAEENSRPALFAAMRRREAYGTSGPRLVVRFFGGWEYPDALCDDPAWIEKGYAGGVPMGGVLPPATAAAPTFLVSALRDLGGTDGPGMPLQRVQIVKGWVDAGGATHERVFEVAGDPDNGASVDPRTCEARGGGFDRLCRVWRDPSFDSAQPAFYYARVVENPSCRWSTYLCNAAGVDCDRPETIADDFAACCDPRYPRVIQERAWTSPIWWQAPRGSGGQP